MAHLTCVGVLLKRKQIDLNLVDDLMRSSIIRLWEKIEPVVKEGRIRWNFPRMFQGADYLYTEMKRRAQQATAS